MNKKLHAINTEPTLSFNCYLPVNGTQGKVLDFQILSFFQVRMRPANSKFGRDFYQTNLVNLVRVVAIS